MFLQRKDLRILAAPFRDCQYIFAQLSVEEKTKEIFWQKPRRVEYMRSKHSHSISGQETQILNLWPKSSNVKDES